MSRAIFFNVSSAGHIFPTFGLVKELVRRGDDIIYFEAPHFKQEIEGFGATFRENPSLGQFIGPEPRNQLALLHSLIWCAQEMLPSLIETVKELEPDYIIHDSLCVWGKIIAQILNIPAVCSISTAAFTEKTFYGNSQMWKVLPKMYMQSRPSIAAFRELARQLEKTYSIPKISMVDAFTNPEALNICYLPSSLQPKHAMFDGTYHFVGPCDPERAIEQKFPFEQLTNKPLVLISFGTALNPGRQFYLDCMEAFRDEDVQVVMVLVPELRSQDLQNIPDNVMVREAGTIPQLTLLKQTDLFIMHGAGGGSREGAWFGVPMIAVPLRYEQTLIAHEIEKQGLGLRLMVENSSPKKIKQLARTILNDPSFKANGKRIADECRDSGGAKRAADLIGEYVESAQRETSTLYLQNKQ